MIVEWRRGNDAVEPVAQEPELVCTHSLAQRLQPRPLRCARPVDWSTDGQCAIDSVLMPVVKYHRVPGSGDDLTAYGAI